MRVLLTDASHKNCLAAVKALTRSGIRVGVVGYSKHDLALISKYPSFKRVIPRTHFLEGLEKAIHDFQPDVLLPIGEKSIIMIQEARTRLDKSVRIPLPPSDLLSIALNKIDANTFFKDQGLPVPDFEVITNIEDLTPLSTKFGFPVVLKGPIGSGSREVAICKTLEEVMTEGGLLLQRHPMIMIQKYIDGIGTGYFGVFRDGVELGHFQHQRIREYPISGGPSTAAKSVYSKDTHQLGRKFLQLLNWTGVAMVEFRKERGSNKLWFIEINAKFWGSLELAILSGVNFPLLAFQSMMQQPLLTPSSYLKTQFRWFLAGDLLYYANYGLKMTDLLQLIFVDKRYVKNDISMRDPVPTSYSLYTTLKRIVRLYIRKVKS